MPEIEVEVMDWNGASKVSQGPTGETWLEIAGKPIELTNHINESKLSLACK